MGTLSNDCEHYHAQAYTHTHTHTHAHTHTHTHTHAHTTTQNSNEHNIHPVEKKTVIPHLHQPYLHYPCGMMQIGQGGGTNKLCLNHMAENRCIIEYLLR